MIIIIIIIIIIITIIILPPQNECFRRYTGLTQLVCPSVCPSVRVSVCQSAGEGMKSHSVTALVIIIIIIKMLRIFFSRDVNKYEITGVVLGAVGWIGNLIVIFTCVTPQVAWKFKRKYYIFRRYEGHSVKRGFKGGFLNFSHLTESKNLYH